MKFYYITFRSVTHAQRGEHILLDAGVRCTLLRTPKWMEERGCGYCLRLRTADIRPVLVLLRQLPLRKVYIQDSGGQLEEWLA